MYEEHLSANNSAIILVNYNNATDTIACIESIENLAYPVKHVVIVDNNSEDGSIDKIISWLEKFNNINIFYENTYEAKNLKKYLVIKCSKNYGFSGGNNVAMRLLMKTTTCCAFWLLNNDTIVDSYALEYLCSRLNEVPEAGACGSTIVFQKNKNIVQCAGGASLAKCFGTTTFICGGITISDLKKYSTSKVESKLDEIIGASLYVRRSVVEQCGLMDERYFIYREDSEWCTRFKKFGFKLTWARDSFIKHKEGGSTGAQSYHNIKNTEKSLLVDTLEIRNRFFFLRTYFIGYIPIAFLSLLLVFFNRLKRGQWHRIPRLLISAINGISGKMTYISHI